MKLEKGSCAIGSGVNPPVLVSPEAGEIWIAPSDGSKPPEKLKEKP